MAKKDTTVDITTEDAFFIDFSAVPDLGPLPAGQYDASIVTAKPGMSQSGNPKIDVAWRVEGGEYEGRQIFDTLSWHPNAIAITKKRLRDLGFDENFSGAISPEDLIGISALLTVTIQESDQVNPETGENYEPRNRVSRIAGGNAGDLEMAL